MSEKKVSCVLCDAKLESKEDLQEHFRKHANKQIDNKGRFKKCIPIIPEAKEVPSTSIPPASGENAKIVCDVCPMEFDTVTTAIQHKFRKHPESNIKHFCGFCGMQFPLKFTHDKHLSTHKGMTKRGDFPCPDCGVLFYNIGAQNYHVKSIHKRIMALFKPVATPPPSKKIKINNAKEAQSAYYCYLCGQEYIIKFNLQKHLERSHTATERDTAPQDLIKCTTCDALFYNKKAYENHNMYHKSDDLYVTSEEQRLQTVSRVDQDFDIRRVQLQADKFIPIEKPSKRRPNYAMKKTAIAGTEAKVKREHMMRSDSDDELSPTSSVDSTDSDSDSDVCAGQKRKKTKAILKPSDRTKSAKDTRSHSNAANNKVDSKAKQHKSIIKSEIIIDGYSVDEKPVDVLKIKEEKDAAKPAAPKQNGRKKMLETCKTADSKAKKREIELKSTRVLRSRIKH